MAIFRLADRLHKTPAEIREGFGLDEYLAFVTYMRIVEEEQAAK